MKCTHCTRIQLFYMVCTHCTWIYVIGMLCCSVIVSQGASVFLSPQMCKIVFDNDDPPFHQFMRPVGSFAPHSQHDKEDISHRALRTLRLTKELLHTTQSRVKSRVRSESSSRVNSPGFSSSKSDIRVSWICKALAGSVTHSLFTPSRQQAAIHFHLSKRNNLTSNVVLEKSLTAA